MTCPNCGGVRFVRPPRRKRRRECLEGLPDEGEDL